MALWNFISVSPMASHLTEDELWAVNLASRLKLIQANFAGDSAEARREYITEEIERALNDVSPGRRETRLQALSRRFPSWQPETLAPAPAPAPGTPETPEALLERFIQSSVTLSREAKSEFVDKLENAGFPVARGGGGDAGTIDISPEVKKKLGLREGQEIDPQRLVKLATGLTELVQALDQLVWTLWKQIAPKSSYRKESDFIKLMGPYLAGDPETSTQMVAQPLERTRRLIAAFLGSVGRAGSTFAKKHVSRFAPEVIVDWARMEKKWNESLEFACWRKYQEHYKDNSSEQAIENEIQEAIVKATENLIMGRMSG